MQNNQSLNKTIAEYRKNFYKVYQDKIVPIFCEFEKVRKKMIMRLIVLEILCAIIAWIFFKDVFCGKSEIYAIEFFVKLSIIIFSVWLIFRLPFYFNRIFTVSIKDNCMWQILDIFGGNNKVIWRRNINLMSDDMLVASALFPIFNIRTDDDGFFGNYNDRDFIISETHLEYNGRGGNKGLFRFNGVVINFEVNKVIKDRTIVVTKGDDYRGISDIIYATILICIGIVIAYYDNNIFVYTTWFFVCLGCIIWKVIEAKGKNLNEIKLEDPEFNKKYRAYSSDQVEGRYLITPAFMERFKNIQTAFGTDKVKCSFFGNNLMFAISTRKNLFEIGNLFYSLENPKQLEIFFNELTSIFMLIDYFKLNEKTGL